MLKSFFRINQADLLFEGTPIRLMADFSTEFSQEKSQNTSTEILSKLQKKMTTSEEIKEKQIIFKTSKTLWDPLLADQSLSLKNRKGALHLEL